MPSTEDIKADIEQANRLHQEAVAKMEEELNSLMHEEAKAVIAQMKIDIKKYMITAKDLGFSAMLRKSPKKGEKVPPKVIHPTDGRTWSGRGTKPTWVRELESVNLKL